VGDLVVHHCTGPNPMSGSVIRIEANDDPLDGVHHHYGGEDIRSLGTQWITGGQLRIVERVLDGDLFAWGVLLHTKMMGQVNRCRRSNSVTSLSGPFWWPGFLRGCLCCAPEDFARAHGATRVVTDVVGPCVGPNMEVGRVATIS
jgi:hypothetical protein